MGRGSKRLVAIADRCRRSHGMQCPADLHNAGTVLERRVDVYVSVDLFWACRFLSFLNRRPYYGTGGCQTSTALEGFWKTFGRSSRPRLACGGKRKEGCAPSTAYSVWTVQRLRCSC